MQEELANEELAAATDALQKEQELDAGVCVYIYTSVYVYIYIYIHACIHTYIYTCASIHV